MTWYVINFTCVFFIFFLLRCHSVLSQLSSSQTTVMHNLYHLIEKDSTCPPTWNNLTTYPEPCSWKGVHCNSNKSAVIHLHLPFFSISSPQFLGNVCKIETLESIDLSNNHLSFLPSSSISDCGKISGLKVLNFSKNKLSGPLPTFVGFPSLQYLDLSYNHLGGYINSQLDGLGGLKSLNLSFNHFTSSVPIGKWGLLEELSLSINNFYGEIPQEIGRYSNLGSIDLSGNNLSGLIPDEFENLSKLRVLVLSSNNLRGGIPKFLSSIQNLFRFAANQNKFSGPVPSGITNNLRYLDLSYNMLSGPLPNDLLSQPNLQSLDLSNNRLEGSIPPEEMSPSLTRLRLESNSLKGEIPSSLFGSLQNLTYLELQGNSLSGPVPPELGFCKCLALLNLANNKLTGPVPKQLTNLANLQELKLQFNKLVGEIPIEIIRLQNLRKLNLSSNQLNGSIPESISSLTRLTNLDLRGNNLTGAIPASIGKLKFLLELQLANNQLGGKIESMPMSLQIALNLSSNHFGGPIPASLYKLSELEVLDLSNNQFNGTIPEYLTRLGSLTELLLSNNKLSGVIPKFGNYVFLDVRGNEGLINVTSSPNTPPSAQNKRKAVVEGVLIAVAVAVTFVGVAGAIAVTIARRFYKINEEQVQCQEGFAQPQLIRGNLLTSNTIHRSNIDFPKALAAVTVPANITLKTRFSTYYKAVMPSGISYLVKKLNWSDKIFQLGGHEKFGEELQVLGRLNNSNIMTPLAYILTSESAYLFYEFAQKGTLFDALHGSSGEALDWARRYSIAIGLAQGLSFLHGCTTGPILLLDLSSKSILLRSLKEPQIGDIELCKVIDPSKNTSSLSTVAGSVGFIPPEYAYTMRVTMAGNVYSFGVVLLELLTGKPAVSEGTELAKWVLSKSMKQGKLDQILDTSLSRTSTGVRNQMLAVLKVAIACVSVSPEARPKTESLLRLLLNAR
ncbi:Receptor protein-tyrosine kinase [Bertholletia excelsa]